MADIVVAEAIFVEVPTHDQILRRCTICHVVKPIGDFNKDKHRYGGHSNKCRSCVKKKYGARWKESHYETSGLTGYWSKWGGVRQSVVKDEIETEWFCQSCTSVFPVELTPYRYEYPQGEYIRVCAACLNNDCECLKKRTAQEPTLQTLIDTLIYSDP